VPIDLRFDPNEIPLLTDLYELTMAASYFEQGFNRPACFGMAVRRLPPRRGFLVAAGLERLLEALEEFKFETATIEYLASLQIFKPSFLDYLRKLRFTGEVHAMDEGTIFFAGEPIIEVRAPLIEAQLLETLVINQIGMASLIASKAARSVIVARGKRLVDFGLRRSQGETAGLIAARSSYLAGFDGTSNVLAGRRYGIPLYGTMAHSYIMAHAHEREAFEHFMHDFPHLSTLLVDTYDTVRGVENAMIVAQKMSRKGVELQGVRLDSGNLADLSAKAHDILDRNGFQRTSIFASGNLNEYKIKELIAANAPIDTFGVGTDMVVSGDAPSLELAYKLTEYDGIPRIKTSEGKLTIPGKKQIFRALDHDLGFGGDLIALADEDDSTGECVSLIELPPKRSGSCLCSSMPVFGWGHVRRSVSRANTSSTRLSGSTLPIKISTNQKSIRCGTRSLLPLYSMKRSGSHGGIRSKQRSRYAPLTRTSKIKVGPFCPVP
jgi:nicotinate phosphoribosyltransferase